MDRFKLMFVNISFRGHNKAPRELQILLGQYSPPPPKKKNTVLACPKEEYSSWERWGGAG